GRAVHSHAGQGSIYIILEDENIPSISPPRPRRETPSTPTATTVSTRPISSTPSATPVSTRPISQQAASRRQHIPTQAASMRSGRHNADMPVYTHRDIYHAAGVELAEEENSSLHPRDLYDHLNPTESLIIERSADDSGEVFLEGPPLHEILARLVEGEMEHDRPEKIDIKTRRYHTVEDTTWRFLLLDHDEYKRQLIVRFLHEVAIDTGGP
ncbi:unnamed protein product, partial [Owenia fusiformis]